MPILYKPYTVNKNIMHRSHLHDSLPTFRITDPQITKVLDSIDSFRLRLVGEMPALCYQGEAL